MKNLVVFTDFGPTVNYCVRTDPSPSPDPDMFSYYGVRANLHLGIQFGFWMNDGSRMNHCHSLNYRKNVLGEGSAENTFEWNCQSQGTSDRRRWLSIQPRPQVYHPHSPCPGSTRCPVYSLMLPVPDGVDPRGEPVV